jgi:hypothetical protein
MVEGLHEVAGEAGSVGPNGKNSLEIDGKEYVLRPKTLRHYVERETHILGRTSPMSLLEHIPLAIRGDDRVRIENKIVQGAIAQPRFVTLSEDALFDNSIYGTAYELWRSLRDDYPEIKTVEDALELVEKAGPHRYGEIRAALNVRAEDPLMGKSDGPQRRAEDETTGSEDEESDGQESFAPSRKSTGLEKLKSLR